MDCVYYVVGGDRRSCYMSLSLAEKGSNVFHFDPYDADLLRHSPVTIISGASGVGFRRLIEGMCVSICRNAESYHSSCACYEGW